nr:unnamed protein product [Callosobruchus chinensis]
MDICSHVIQMEKIEIEIIAGFWSKTTMLKLDLPQKYKNFRNYSIDRIDTPEPELNKAGNKELCALPLNKTVDRVTFHLRVTRFQILLGYSFIMLLCMMQKRVRKRRISILIPTSITPKDHSKRFSFLLITAVQERSFVASVSKSISDGTSTSLAVYISHSSVDKGKRCNTCLYHGAILLPERFPVSDCASSIHINMCNLPTERPVGHLPDFAMLPSVRASAYRGHDAWSHGHLPQAATWPLCDHHFGPRGLPSRTCRHAAVCSFSQGRFCVLFALCTAAVLRPSVPGGLYFIIFLCTATWWAGCKQLRKGFAVLMLCLAPIVVAHLFCLLFGLTPLYNQTVYKSLDATTGLALANTTTEDFNSTVIEEPTDPRVFVYSDLEWAAFVNPIAIYVLFYLIILEAKELLKPELIRGVSPSKRHGSGKRSGIYQDSTGSVTVTGMEYNILELANIYIVNMGQFDMVSAKPTQIDVEIQSISGPVCLVPPHFGLHLLYGRRFTINGVDLAEFGFVKVTHLPCAPLFVKCLYTAMFWVTLRQYIQERAEQRHSSALADMAAPLQITVGAASAGTNRNNAAGADGQEKTGSKFSFQIWRKMMFGFWLTVIIYSMIILVMVYTYQFKNFPKYWTDYLHIPEEHQVDAAVTDDLEQSSMQGGAYVDRSEKEEPSSQIQFDFYDLDNITSAQFQLLLKQWLKRLHRAKNLCYLFLELHMSKAVLLFAMLMCVYDKCALYFVIVVLISLALTFGRPMQTFAIYFSSLLVSVMLLSRMIYQIQYITPQNWDVNCTKGSSLPSLVKWNIIYILVVTLWAVILVRQYNYRLSRGRPTTRAFFMFPNVKRTDADTNLRNCLKYLANYGYYKFGVEISLMMTVAVIGTRMDMYSVLYSVWLCVLFSMKRSTLSKVWLFYLIFLAIALPFQYFMAVGLPPTLCQEFPWDRKDQLLHSLQDWAYLLDNYHPPPVKKLVLDFILLLLVSRQWVVFRIEKRYARAEYAGGSNEVIIHHAEEKDFKNPVLLGYLQKGDSPKFSEYCTVPREFIGIAWDGLCFGLLIMQRRIFHSYNFFHIVDECKATTILASRGAELIEEIRQKMVHNQEEQEHRVLEKIKMKMDRIKANQQKIQASSERGAPPLAHSTSTASCSTASPGAGYHTPVEEDEEEGDVPPPTASSQITSSVGGQQAPPSPYSAVMTVSLEGYLEPQRLSFSSPPNSELNPRPASPDDSFPVFSPPPYNHAPSDILVPPTASGRAAANPAPPYSAIGVASTTASDRRRDIIGPPWMPQNTYQTPRQSVISYSSRSPLSHHEYSVKGKRKYRIKPPVTNKQAIRSGDYYMFDELDDDDIDLLPEEQAVDEEDKKSAINKPDIGEIDEHDVRSVRIQEEPETEEEPQPGTSKDEDISDLTESKETIGRKILQILLFIWAFLESSMISLTNFLNRYSRDYRYVLKVLSKEKKILKVFQCDEKVKTSPTPSIIHPEVEELSQYDQPTIVRLLLAIWYIVMSRSEILCYSVIFLNQMKTSTLITLPLPMMVFFWGSLTIPRPSKTFWVTIIAYTEAIVLLKCIFQFDIVQGGSSVLSNVDADPLMPTKLLGLYRKEAYAMWDLLLLLVVFFHRVMLKSLGIWTTSPPTTVALLSDGEYRLEDGQLIPIGSSSPRTESDNTHQDTPNSTAKSRNGSKSSSGRSSPGGEIVSIEVKKEVPFKHYSKTVQMGFAKYGEGVRIWLHQLLDPTSRVAADVYSLMFLCDFINFFVILFGYSSFGGSGVVPIHVDIAVHVDRDRSWYLPQEKYFGQNRVPVPTDHPVAYLVVHRIYVGSFPFELRTCMDWMWTETSMTVFDWIKMEDIFAHIFLLKVSLRMISEFDLLKESYIDSEHCQRHAEDEFPQPRGEKKNPLPKYMMGGAMLAVIIGIIWFPLVFFSLGNAVGETNVPYDVTLEIRIGPYEPIYRMSAQSNSIYSFKPDQLEQLRMVYNNFKSSGTFINNYEAADIAAVKLSIDSGNIWGISPPDRKRMLAEINSTETEDRTNLLKMLEGLPADPVLLQYLLPKFIKVTNRGTVEPVEELMLPQPDEKAASLRNITTNLNKTGDEEWWRIREECNDTNYELFLRDLPYQDCSNSIILYTFNDKVFPPTLEFISVASRILRSFFADQCGKIMFEDLPNVDRVLQLCLDIYLVREACEFALEEDLFAKLVFLFRYVSSLYLHMISNHIDDDLKRSTLNC